MQGETWQATDDELCDTIVEIEARMRRDYATLLSILSEADTRGLAKTKGYSSLTYLLQDLTCMSTVEAKERARQAGAVSPARLITGGETPARLPITGDAARAGEISGEHIRVIERHMSALPKWVTDEQRAAVEQVLVEQARISPPHAVNARGKELLARIDQDGKEPKDDDPRKEPRNVLRYCTKKDGRVAGSFDLDPEVSALFLNALAPLAKPLPATDGIRDDRRTEERNGDALAELIRLSIAAEGMPTVGGHKPHLNVTVPLEVLESRIGTALLDGAGYISAEHARYLACDAKVIPIVLGGRSVPVDVAVPRYTVPAGMRRALVNRDRGCSFPGCTQPHWVSASHHIIPWLDGGETKLSNLVLLCGRHHRLIHGSEWTVQLVHGRPEFTPPIFVDPKQVPRRNTTHHQIN